VLLDGSVQLARSLLAVGRVRRAYSVWAKQYIDLFGSATQVDTEDLDLIARYLSIRPGVVLDVGCGPGHLTAHLRSLDVDAIGLDMVPEFIEHARTTYPDGRYELGSMHELRVPDRSVAGILAWYSLIHVPPDDLDGMLAELRRASTPACTLIAGFFDGEEVSAFEHTVTTAYSWPVDEFAARLRRAGFHEVERSGRPGVREPRRRPHAAIAAIAD
jgi:ubiquinone/menaquinone biosynthesis C-methylase UbiE